MMETAGSDQEAWSLALARATLFPVEPFDPSNLDLWPSVAMGALVETDQSQRVPLPQRLQTGMALGGRLSIQLAPGRIDVLLSGDPAEVTLGRLPSVLNAEEAIASFADMASHLSGLTGLRQGRLAFAIQVLLPQASAQVVLRALKAVLPGLPISEGDQDATFQRVRRMQAAVSNYDINYIERWGSARLQVVPAMVPGTPTVTLPEVHALQREVEANTEPLSDGRGLDDPVALMRELATLVRRGLGGGLA